MTRNNTQNNNHRQLGTWESMEIHSTIHTLCYITSFCKEQLRLCWIITTPKPFPMQLCNLCFVAILFMALSHYVWVWQPTLDIIISICYVLYRSHSSLQMTITHCPTINNLQLFKYVGTENAHVHVCLPAYLPHVAVCVSEYYLTMAQWYPQKWHYICNYT
jgi:hypothetical protein